MANRSERQLHESGKKALMKHFPHVKEAMVQQLEVIKALRFTEKDTFAVLPTADMGNPFNLASWL